MFSIFKYFQKSSVSPNNKKFLIVGLGNIGEEYKNTRHNIGFDIVDQLGKILKGTFNSAKYGDILKSKYAGKQVMLLKPNTFMNLSGKAVLYWIRNNFKKKDQVDFVLSKWNNEEANNLENLINKNVEIIFSSIKQGLDFTMNKYN